MIAHFLLLVLAPCSGMGAEPFREIDLDAAIAAAKREQKAVVAAFGTHESPDTRKLDSTTWVEPRVREWIAKNAVAIRIDPEKRADLAARYRVHILPTIVFVSAQGTEMDRLTGYVDGRTFRSEADLILAGSDALARVRKRLVGHENDASLRIDLGGALFDRGLLQESLVEYLWCWDHGLEGNPAFAEERAGFLLREIQRLGRVYTSAVDALAERARVLLDHVTECKATQHDIDDFVAVERTLDREDRILEAYDRTPIADEPCVQTRAQLAAFVLDPLIDARRYAEAAQLGGDALQALAARVATFEEDRKRWQKDRGGEAASLIEAASKKLRLDSARRYETLLGAKRYDEAASFATRLLAFDAHGGTYVLLIQAAIRAEAHGAARSIASRAYGDPSLPDAEKLEIKAAARNIVLPK